jgi:hypothetical protein
MKVFPCGDEAQMTSTSGSRDCDRRYDGRNNGLGDDTQDAIDIMLDQTRDQGTLQGRAG